MESLITALGSQRFANLYPARAANRPIEWKNAGDLNEGARERGGKGRKIPVATRNRRSVAIKFVGIGRGMGDELHERNGKLR